MLAIFLGVKVLTASQGVGILGRRSDFERRNCDERSENPWEASWKNYVQSLVDNHFAPKSWVRKIGGHFISNA